MAAISYCPRYSVAEYDQWKGDWELWDGFAVSMSPSPGFAHQNVAGNLYAEIREQLRGGERPDDCRALFEIDWRVDDHTVVRPDLIVICEAPEGEWIEKRPELVAEILSPSTRQKDLTSKRELYASMEVPHYLILDPEEQSGLLLELDEKGTYRELAPDSRFEVNPECVLKLSLETLFS